jgi:hypothetical protein
MPSARNGSFWQSAQVVRQRGRAVDLLLALASPDSFGELGDGVQHVEELVLKAKTTRPSRQ